MNTRHGADNGRRRADRAEEQQRANRQIGETEDAVERVAKLAAERPGASTAAAARAALVRHEGPPEAEPEQQRDQVRLRLPQFQQPIAHLSSAPEDVDAALRHVRHHETAVDGPETLGEPSRQERVGPPGPMSRARRPPVPLSRCDGTRGRARAVPEGLPPSRRIISPRACCNPAAIAANEPKFRLSSMSCDRRAQPGRCSRRMRSEASGLPSTTKTTSRSSGSRVANASRSANKRGRLASFL